MTDISSCFSFAIGEKMDAELSVTEYSLKIFTKPGRPLPSLEEIKELLDVNFEPHVGFKVQPNVHES